MTSQSSPRAWFITGVSSGLGRSLAKAVLASGDLVAGTVRKDSDRADFEALAPQRALGLIMDVTDEAAVQAAVAAAEAKMGRIDILVGNAGYGLIGAIEETSLAEMRAQFEVNVFGALAVIQAVLPGMRARHAGRILTVTSVSGLAAWGGTGIYCASKFALEGATQALAQEVEEFGIKVTNIAPGGMRTDYAGRSLVQAQRRIADYEDGPGRAASRILAEHAGAEPGDPARVAAAILAIVDAPDPPVHLILGADALGYAEGRIAQLQQDIAAWRALSLTTGFEL